jgi:hypothetical protein
MSVKIPRRIDILTSPVAVVFMLAMVGEGISNPIALASGSPAPSLFTRDPSKDFDTLAAAGNSAPAGI